MSTTGFQLSDLQTLIAARSAGLTGSALQMSRNNTDVDVLALTLFGEGRSESLDGRCAIAWTVQNRVNAWGQSVTDRCLQKSQYSTWFPYGGVDNYRRTLDLAEKVFKSLPLDKDQAIYRECKYVAQGVMSRWLRDRTNGALHYMTTDLYNSHACPSWAAGPEITIVVIGAHTFFRGVK